MIALLYGRVFAALLVAPLERLIGAGADRRSEFVALSIERALERPALCARVERLYILPFDLPAGETEPVPAVLKHLFPRAEFLNPPEVHELCWDKVRTNSRLLERGVSVPESLYTSSPEEARTFVAENQFVILKEILGCGGAGHIALCDTEDVVVGEARDRRFVVEFDDTVPSRRLAEGVLSCPPPYYLQKLVGTADAKERFIPPQVLRAYIVDRQITFWTERYRDHYRRPSDWIINVGLGARYRFVAETSAELRTLALRAADVLDIRVGAIDIVRTSGSGPFVIEADTDGHHMYIDRSFVQIPDFRAPYDFDAQIAAALTAPVPEVPRRGVPAEQGDQGEGRGNREQGRGNREEERGIKEQGRRIREERRGAERADRGGGDEPARRTEGERDERRPGPRAPRYGVRGRDEARPQREFPPRRPFGPPAPRGAGGGSGPRREWRSSEAGPRSTGPRTRGGPRTGPWPRDERGPRSAEGPPARAPRGFATSTYSRGGGPRGAPYGEGSGPRGRESQGRPFAPESRPRRRKTEVTFTKGVRNPTAVPASPPIAPAERGGRERNEPVGSPSPRPRSGPPPRRGGGPSAPVAGPRRGPWRRADGDSRGGPPPRARTSSPTPADERRSPLAKGKPWRKREGDERRGGPAPRIGPRTRGGPRSGAPAKTRKGPAPRRGPGPRKGPPPRGSR